MNGACAMFISIRAVAAYEAVEAVPHPFSGFFLWGPQIFWGPQNNMGPVVARLEIYVFESFNFLIRITKKE